MKKLNRDDYKRDIAEFFDSVAHEYEQTVQWKKEKKILNGFWKDKYININSSVLDVGAGTSLVSKWYKQKVSRTVAVDISFEMLKKANRVVNFCVQCDIEHLPFQKNAFDLILCRQALHYVDYRVCLSELYRISKPGAYFILGHITSSGSKDFEWWREAKRLIQPLRKHSFSPKTLKSAVSKSGFRLLNSEVIHTQRKETFEGYMKKSRLSQERVQCFFQFLERAPDSICQLINLRVTPKTVFYLQTWTIVYASK